ncbi:MAG: 23S rRNA (pseudouridine(1915)-N(3))-methyltransferase RlmH [Clostridia bacterium]|nr:23S rRNA (pseudouridine(1915)-N(3))-methyltransferase RlmH [Clostridia bacterium]
MNMAILCVGRLRERFYRQAADEYLKRLRRFGACAEIEVADLPEPANPSPALEAEVRRKEGERLLAALRPGDYVVALCVNGAQCTSEALAGRVTASRARSDIKRVVWVIGGSLGLGEAVTARANERLSLSAMTLPHQLARVVLLEQLYRACKIAANERYHK